MSDENLKVRLFALEQMYNRLQTLLQQQQAQILALTQQIAALYVNQQS